MCKGLSLVLEKDGELNDAIVIGVVEFSKDKVCQQCNGPVGASDCGRCSSCRMLQAYTSR